MNVFQKSENAIAYLEGIRVYIYSLLHTLGGASPCFSFLCVSNGQKFSSNVFKAAQR